MTTTITDPSARVVLPPIERLRRLVGIDKATFGQAVGTRGKVQPGELVRTCLVDGVEYVEPLHHAPTFSEIRDDLAAKLEADTDGSVHGVVLWVLDELGLEVIRDRQGLFMFVKPVPHGWTPIRSETRTAPFLAALDHAHAKGLL